MRKKIFLLLLMLILFMPKLVSAENNFLYLENGFYVSSIINTKSNVNLPDKCEDFNIQLNPGATQIITVKIYNSNDVDLNLDVITAPFGCKTISDLRDGFKNIINPEFAFNKLVKHSKCVNVPAKSMIEYSMEITAPSSSFAGIIAGKVVFSYNTRKPCDAKNCHLWEKQSVNIQLYGTPQKVPGNVELTDVHFFNDPKSKIVATLQNINNSFIKRAESLLKIYKKNDRNHPVSVTQLPKDSADNSRLDFNPNEKIEYETCQGLDPGEYVYVQDIVNSEGSWHVEKDFSVPKFVNFQSEKKRKRQIFRQLTNFFNNLKVFLLLIIFISVITAGSILIFNIKNETK